MIFNIQRYSTHDGPGIRSVVFLKGCSLKCRWCQNPESRSAKKELLFDARLCTARCNLCQDAVPDVIQRTLKGIVIRRENMRADHIDKLENCCPFLALTVCGQESTAEEIMEVIKRDRPFYDRSGGGITLSGGEPFMSPVLAKTLLQLSHREGIHTAVETCLHVPWKYIEPALPYTNLVLADLKHVNERLFKNWTHGSAKRVLHNLQTLASAGKEMIIRVPLIQGFNADEASIQSIVNFAADELGARTIHFLPYHVLGRNKYVLLEQPYLAPDKPLNNPTLLAFAQSYSEKKGLTVTLKG